MCPIDLFPKGKSANCSVSRDGTISLPQRVIDAVNWHPGDTIAVRYIPSPITLLLWGSRDGHPGYTLSYLSRSGQQRRGGKLNCRAFSTEILRPRMTLPLRNIPAALLQSGDYELALLLEPVPWTTIACSMTDCQSIPAEAVGVYQLLGTNQVALKIGEGFVQNRLKEHLRDEALTRQARTMQYALMPKEDSVILEKVLLALFEAEYGSLPVFNTIRS